MDFLKTPHQMLLEEAGAKTPNTDGMLKTPQQMLLEETGLPQKFAPGGKVNALANLAKFLEGSKVPQRLYHGTTASEKGGAEALQQLKQSREGALGAGVYMTPNPEFAGQYAGETGGYIMPVHANLRNPLEIHTKSGVEGNGDPMKLALMQLGVPEAKADQILEKAYDTRGYVGKEVMSRAQKQGYDGIAQYRDGDLSEVVSYNPMGVKSATGNVGDFDPYDPRLSKAEGGSINKSPEDMIAEIMAQGQTPQKFKDGGQPEFGEARAYENKPSEAVHDWFAKHIGYETADRLFGGPRADAADRLLLQSLNPINYVTGIADSAKGFYESSKEGDYPSAAMHYGIGALNALPFLGKGKSIAQRLISPMSIKENLPNFGIGAATELAPIKAHK